MAELETAKLRFPTAYQETVMLQRTEGDRVRKAGLIDQTMQGSMGVGG
jgi:hypothetical protein